MSDVKGYELLADAFVAEGVDTMFALMGDANMHWVSTIAQKPGVRVVQVRHEHCACAMAEGYARATGKVGVASVTCGPGFTQIMTALTVAARGNWPMVVFAGDAPTNVGWYIQQIDQGPLTVATGAHYVPVRHLDRLLDCVREAFHVARNERRPVVLSVPMDLQKQTFPWAIEYAPSSNVAPTAQRVMPDPDVVGEIAAMIRNARCPIIVAGRGAVRAGAGPQLEALAEHCGALLGTSLFAKGLFDGNPFSIGIAGSFSTHLARKMYAECDLMIGVGASLGHFTTEAGYLCPEARVVQIDTNPKGLFQGLRVADLYLRADAAEAASAILNRLRELGKPTFGVRTMELARSIENDAQTPDPKQFEASPGLLDPRAVMREIDKIVPKDWDIVFGSGHYASIAATWLRGRAPERYHIVNEFGAIGSAFATAVGIAATRGDGKVALIEGDGSMLMHIQELETVRRHSIGLLMCIINDGGYGAEVHKLRAQGVDASGAIHGRGDLGAIARGFGLGGAMVSSLDRLAPLFREHAATDGASLWDIHVDDKIPSAAYRRIHYGES